jgi:hypothetical protein
MAIQRCKWIIKSQSKECFVDISGQNTGFKERGSL